MTVCKSIRQFFLQDLYVNLSAHLLLPLHSPFSFLLRASLCHLLSHRRVRCATGCWPPTPRSHGHRRRRVPTLCTTALPISIAGPTWHRSSALPRSSAEPLHHAALLRLASPRFSIRSLRRGPRAPLLRLAPLLYRAATSRAPFRAAALLPPRTTTALPHAAPPRAPSHAAAPPRWPVRSPTPTQNGGWRHRSGSE